jgi:FkbM family methyltransferase
MDWLAQAFRNYARSELPLPGRQSAFRKFSRRIRGERHEITTTRGFRMSVTAGDSVANQLLAYGEFEPGLTRRMAELARPGMVFVDVGCNVGYFSCLIGHLAPTARIVSLDANPEMAEECRRNLERNGRTASVLPVGLGREDARLTLRFTPLSPSHATFGTVTEGAACREVETAVISFDRLLERENLGRIDLLKMDVEGFEGEILGGLREDQAVRVEHWLLEFCEKNLQRCGSSRRQLASLPWLSRYDLFYVSMRDGQTFPVASLADVPKDEETVWLRRR